MNKIKMPAMKPQTRGRKSQVFFIRDVEGDVFEVHSLRRFAELTKKPLKSYYSLTSGRSATFFGMTMVDPEDAPDDCILVTADTEVE